MHQSGHMFPELETELTIGYFFLGLYRVQGNLQFIGDFPILIAQ